MTVLQKHVVHFYRSHVESRSNRWSDHSVFLDVHFLYQRIIERSTWFVCTRIATALNERSSSSFSAFNQDINWQQRSPPSLRFASQTCQSNPNNPLLNKTGIRKFSTTSSDLDVNGEIRRPTRLRKRHSYGRFVFCWAVRDSEEQSNCGTILKYDNNASPEWFRFLHQF